MRDHPINTEYLSQFEGHFRKPTTELYESIAHHNNVLFYPVTSRHGVNLKQRKLENLRGDGKSPRKTKREICNNKKIEN